MKNLRAPQMGVIFAGCFLGAGFVSGQELWQFFGTFGLVGMIGLGIAISILFGFGILLLRLAQMTGIESMDKIVIPWNVPFLRNLAALLQCLFLFGVNTIMIAGAGALVQQLFGIPAWLPSLCMTAGLIAMAIMGMQSVVNAFSLTVPLIVICTLVFAGLSLIFFGPEQFSAPAGSSPNPLLPNWIVAAFTYAAYNIFGSIGILTPLGKFVPSKKRVYGGIGLGAIFLLTIASSVLCSLFMHNSAASAELPMLALASDISPVCGYIYGFLLLAGMFGNALSSVVAIQAFLSRKFTAAEKHPKTAIFLLTGSAFCGSLMGFGDLVGTVYPIFGYLSIVLLLCLIIHFVKVKCRLKTESAHV